MYPGRKLNPIPPRSGLLKLLCLSALVAMATLLAGCNDVVGEGNRLERVYFSSQASLGAVADTLLKVDDSDPQNVSGTIYQCLEARLLLLGEFTDHSVDTTLGNRDATQWRSSNPSVIAVTNPHFETDGTFVSGGLVTALGSVGESATISVSYLSLSTSITLTIGPARLEITPGVAQMAAGTQVEMHALAIIDNRTVLDASDIVNFNVENHGAAEASYDIASFVFDAIKGGSAPADSVTVKVTPKFSQCPVFNVSRTIRINNQQFDQLEVIDDAGQRLPNSITLPPSSLKTVRVYGIATQDDGNGGQTTAFRQNLTFTFRRRQLLAIPQQNDDNPPELPIQPLVSDVAFFTPLQLYPHVLLLSTTPVADGKNQGTEILSFRFDNSQASSPPASFNLQVTVNRIALQTLQLLPSSLQLLPASNGRLQVLGTYSDGSTYNLSRSVPTLVLANPDLVSQTSVRTDGLVVTAAADADGSTAVDATRQDTETDTLINSADSGGSAVITVDPAIGKLTVVAGACDSGSTGNGSVPEGRTLAFHACGDNGQDLTSSVIWQVDREIANIDNFPPREGVVTGVQQDANPATVTAYLKREAANLNMTATGSVLVTAPDYNSSSGGSSSGGSSSGGSSSGGSSSGSSSSGSGGSSSGSSSSGGSSSGGSSSSSSGASSSSSGGSSSGSSSSGGSSSGSSSSGGSSSGGSDNPLCGLLPVLCQ